MASIVKANTNLSAGQLAVLKRDFSTTDRGQVTYRAQYVCLPQFAQTHAPSFQSGSNPPTPIPQELSLLNLSQTPTLIDLQSETANGLTYFTASYSAGVESDYIVTTTTDQRSISWTIGYSGQNGVTASFDYMSISVTVEGTNQEVSIIPGSIGDIFNLRNVTLATINAAGNTPTVGRVYRKTVQSARQTRNQRGETFNSVTSSGVFEAIDATPINTDATSSGSTGPGPFARRPAPTQAVFPNFYQNMAGLRNIRIQESYSSVAFR